MTKKKWVIVATSLVVLLLVAAVLLWVFLKPGKTTSKEPETELPQEADEKVITDPIKLMKAFADGSIIGTENEDGTFRLLCGDLADNLPVKDESSAAALIDHYAEQLGIQDFSKEFQDLHITDVAQGTNFRYQQYHNNIPVIGGDLSVITDTENNPVAILNNRVTVPENLDTTVTVTEDDATSAAAAAISQVEGFTAYTKTTACHVIYAPEEEDPYYAWYFVGEVDDYTSFYAIVSATDVTKIAYSSNTSDATGSGQNSFGETKTFTLAESGYYVLTDNDRHVSVHTYVDGNTKWVYSDSTQWTDPTEVDLITNYTVVQDFVSYSLGLNSIDNKGITVVVVDNYINEEKTTNACWNGFTNLNDGTQVARILFSYNPKGETPFTMCLDVCAHEYGHGLFHYYRSGYDSLFFNLPATNAMSEAFADIIGCCVDGNWTIGEDYYTLTSGTEDCFRNLADPDTGDGFRVSMPMSYNMFDGSVHYHNATIVSHVAYKMNALGKISFEDLACIWTNALRFLPTSPSLDDVRDAVFVSMVQLSSTNTIQLTDKQLTDTLSYFKEAGLDGNGMKNLDLKKAGQSQSADPQEPGDTAGVALAISGIVADNIYYYNCPHSGNYAVYEKDGLLGILDYSGNIVVPAQYLEIYPGYGYNYGYLFATDGNTEYVLEPSGQFREEWGRGGDVPPTIYWYNNTYVAFTYETGVVYPGDPEDAWMFYPIISQREWKDGAVLPVQQLAYVINEGDWYTPELVDDSYVLLDLNTGKLVSGLTYDDFDKFNGYQDGLLAIKKNGFWGFIDQQGKEVTDFCYEPYRVDDYGYGMIEERVFTAENGYIAVKQNGKWGLLDTQGNSILPTIYDGLTQVNKDGYLWLREDDKTWSLYKITA